MLVSVQEWSLTPMRRAPKKSFLSWRPKPMRLQFLFLLFPKSGPRRWSKTTWSINGSISALSVHVEWMRSAEITRMNIYSCFRSWWAIAYCFETVDLHFRIAQALRSKREALISSWYFQAPLAFAFCKTCEIHQPCMWIATVVKLSWVPWKPWCMTSWKAVDPWVPWHSSWKGILGHWRLKLSLPTYARLGNWSEKILQYWALHSRHFFNALRISQKVALQLCWALLEAFVSEI